MAVLFSAVTVTAGDQECEFLVRGIPRELKNIEGYSAFEDYIDDIEKDTEVSVHAEAYLYGEGEIVTASLEELAYFYVRMEARDDFLSARCDKIEDVDFSFTWSPDELFNNNCVRNMDKKETEHPNLIGHSIIGNKRLRSIEDVARFICKHGQHSDVTITCEGRGTFIKTCGIFLDTVADMEYRAKLLPVLTKMQQELIEGGGELCVSDDEQTEKEEMTQKL